MSVYLLLCLLVGGELRPVRVLNSEPYKSFEQCESIRTHSAVYGSYAQLYKGQVILVCTEQR